MKINMKVIGGIAALAIGGYFIYRHFTGKEEEEFPAPTFGGGGGGETIYEISIGQNGDYQLDLLDHLKDLFTPDPTPEVTTEPTAPPADAGAIQDFWNLVNLGVTAPFWMEKQPQPEQGIIESVKQTFADMFTTPEGLAFTAAGVSAPFLISRAGGLAGIGAKIRGLLPAAPAGGFGIGALAPLGAIGGIIGGTVLAEQAFQAGMTPVERAERIRVTAEHPVTMARERQTLLRGIGVTPSERISGRRFMRTSTGQIAEEVVGGTGRVTGGGVFTAMKGVSTVPLRKGFTRMKTPTITPKQMAEVAVKAVASSIFGGVL